MLDPFNPLKAKQVKNMSELDRYRWTGHAGIMGKHAQAWHCPEDVLIRFSRQKAAAQRKYRAYIKAGLADGEAEALAGGGLIRSYGGWQNVRDQGQKYNDPGTGKSTFDSADTDLLLGK